MYSQNTVFKQPKLRIVFQTLLIKITYQIHFFFAHSFQYLNIENYYLNTCTEQVFSIFKKDVNGSNIPFYYYSTIKKLQFFW